MRMLAKTAVALSFLGATAIGMTATVQAQGFYFGFGHYPYYSGEWRTWNGCPPSWTVQGGVCKPYRYGPWDYYNYGPRYYAYRYRYR